MLERGRHVDPAEFTENERAQFANLYADGGMQMSTDARFQVLQGQCVGGSTVVNNAVCFELPEHVLERWNDGNGLNAGIDEAELAAAFARLREFVPIDRMTARRHARGRRASSSARGSRRSGSTARATSTSSRRTSRTAWAAATATSAARSAASSRRSTTRCRRRRTNIGDAVRIYSECAVERVTPRNGAAAEVECRLGDGRRLRVSANTVVVAAGRDRRRA